MTAWFRMYGEVLDNPKVQRLSGDDFKAWVNLLCLASRHEGALPPVDDIAFALRLDSRKAAAVVDRLTKAGLIAVTETGMEPNAWRERQYKSDGSNERVKRYRERSKKQDGNAECNVTPPVTDMPAATGPDTEQNRTEVPLDKSNGAIDPEKAMFDAGIALLGKAGKSDSAARSALGKWKRDYGPEAVIVALGAAQREGAIEPVSFVEAALRHRAKAPPAGRTGVGVVELSSPC